MNGVIDIKAQTSPFYISISFSCYAFVGYLFTFALNLIVIFVASGRVDIVLKSRNGDDSEIPEILLKTEDIIVIATVPPKGIATAIIATTAAMSFGKRPIPCSVPKYFNISLC